jgi:hypothetical protein
MKHILIIISIFATSLLSAQVPGYQGNRISAELQGRISATFNTDFRLIAPRLSLEYAVGRKSGLNFSYEYSPSTNKMRVDVPDPLFSGYYNSQILPMSITMHKIGLGYTFYWRNYSLSPLGRYTTYSLIYNTATSTLPISGYGTYIGKFSDFAISAKWGRRLILTNKMTLNYGFELTIPLDGYGSSNSNYVNIDPTRGNSVITSTFAITLDELMRSKVGTEGISVFVAIGGVF